MQKAGFTLPELLITLTIIGVASALILPAISSIIPNKDKVMVLNAYSSLGKISAAIADAAPSVKAGKSFATLLKEHLKAEKGATWSISDTTNGGAIAILDVNGVKGKNCIYSTTCKKPDEYKFVIDDDGDVHPADALTIAYLEDPLNTGDKRKALKKAATINVEDWESKQNSKKNHSRYDLSKVKKPEDYEDPTANKEETDNNNPPAEIENPDSGSIDETSDATSDSSSATSSGD